MTDTAQRLAGIRGGVPPRRHNARTIAVLTANPGCTRRAVLDSAGVDKPKLAERIGFPARFGRSRFAITRGNAFEAQVKADGGAPADRIRSPLPSGSGSTPDRLTPGPGAPGLPPPGDRGRPLFRPGTVRRVAESGLTLT